MSRLERDLFPWLGKRPIVEIKATDVLSVLRRVPWIIFNDDDRDTCNYFYLPLFIWKKGIIRIGVQIAVALKNIMGMPTNFLLASRRNEE